MADEIRVNLDVILPQFGPVSGRRADVGALVPDVPAQPPPIRQKQLPAQPTDVPPGMVWAGPEDGLVPYSGTKPRPGDLIAIVGGTARRFVTSGMAGEAMRWPTFSGGCRCQCPGNAGLVVYSSSCRDTANLIALDAVTGDVLQFFGMNELGTIGGLVNINGFTSFQSVAVAIDPVSPYDLWAVDDRRFWLTRRLDSAPTAVRGYFTLVRYEITAGQYVATDYVDLDDPGTTGGTPNDPPAFGTNFLSVLNGLPVISLQNSPARYLSASGGVITEHSLLLDGSPYDRGLRGNIATVTQAPARASRHYVMGTDGSGFEVIEFNDNDEVTRVLPITGMDFPFHLAAFCNRLLVLNASIDES